MTPAPAPALAPGPALVAQAPLSPAEARELARLEGELRAYRMSYKKAGLALREIRGKRLYRDTHPDDFEGYCEQVWEFNRQRAQQLIEAATLVDHMSKILDAKAALPANDAQARALLPLGEPNAAAEVWQEALEYAQRVGVRLTAAVVTDRVRERLAPRQLVVEDSWLPAGGAETFVPEEASPAPPAGEDDFALPGEGDEEFDPDSVARIAVENRRRLEREASARQRAEEGCRQEDHARDALDHFRKGWRHLKKVPGAEALVPAVEAVMRALEGFV